VKLEPALSTIWSSWLRRRELGNLGFDLVLARAHVGIAFLHATHHSFGFVALS